MEIFLVTTLSLNFCLYLLVRYEAWKIDNHYIETCCSNFFSRNQCWLPVTVILWIIMLIIFHIYLRCINLCLFRWVTNKSAIGGACHILTIAIITVAPVTCTMQIIRCTIIVFSIKSFIV